MPRGGCLARRTRAWTKRYQLSRANLHIKSFLTTGWRTGMKMVLPAQLIPAAVISLLVLFPPHCTLAADVTRGKTIAQRWCSSCHLVAAEQTRAVADVPSFAAVARAKLPADSLKAFLSDPHPKMPDMSLTRSEIEDIVAYIQSLGR
jgi:mono/diheme cytochrome c family protein